MTPVFTAKGDNGFTGLLKEGRFPKHDRILEAVGTIDEAGAALGIGRASCRADLSKHIILTVQGDLYHLMAEVAASPENASQFRKIDSRRVAWLEAQITMLEVDVKTPEEFIVPGDSYSGALLDLARTVVRRAERKLASLTHDQIIENPELLRYLNRLSSLCYLLELYENQLSGKESPTLARDL